MVHTLTYLANSCVWALGGAALGYFLRDIRDAIERRNKREEDLEKDKNANQTE